MDPSWEWFFVPPSFGVRETPGHKLHHYCPHAVDIYQNRSWKHDWMPMVQTWIQRQTNDDHQLVMTAYIEMISTLLNRIRAMFNATSSCLVSMDAAYSHPSTQHPHWIKHIYHHLNQLGSTDQQWHTCRKQKKRKRRSGLEGSVLFLYLCDCQVRLGEQLFQGVPFGFLMCFYDPESIGYLIAHTLQMFHCFF